VNPPGNSSIIFPYPRANIAQARNVEHEGIVSTTIIYAKLPLMDYFRVVEYGNSDGDGLLLLGKSDLQGTVPDVAAYFYLRRQKDAVVDFTYKNP
jgi:hypothetical protein